MQVMVRCKNKKDIPKQLKKLKDLSYWKYKIVNQFKMSDSSFWIVELEELETPTMDNAVFIR